MKAQDFLFGVRDFFTVLVPGATLAFVLLAFGGFSLEEQGTLLEITARTFGALPDSVQVFGFGVLSYALGQAVSAISGLLDLPIDRMERNLGRLSVRDPLLRRYRPAMRLWRYRCLASVLKEQITEQLLGEAGDEAGERPAKAASRQPLWTVKAFWRDYLRLCEPTAIAELDRIESAQKMFRSFGIVLLIALPLVLGRFEPLHYGLTAVLLVAFYALFARFRIEFFYRLYKLAILTTVPEGIVARAGEAFFADAGTLLAKIDASARPSGAGEPAVEEGAPC